MKTTTKTRPSKVGAKRAAEPHATRAKGTAAPPRDPLRKPHRSVRPRAEARPIPPEWLRAIDNVVASAIASDHVDGKPVAKRARALRAMLCSYLPRAAWVLYEGMGHPRMKTGCRCHCYALLQIDAVEVSRARGLPQGVVFAHAMNQLNTYLDSLN